ncbi:hypothetical protein D1872_313780 [compost metagenome]
MFPEQLLNIVNGTRHLVELLLNGFKVLSVGLQKMNQANYFILDLVYQKIGIITAAIHVC